MEAFAPGSLAPPRRAPRFRGSFRFLGPAREFQVDPIRAFFKAHVECGDVARIEVPVAPRVIHVLTHPDHARRVLIDNHKNYAKNSRGYWRLREVLGNGLINSEGDFWKRQRRIMNPAFHHEQVARFAEIMVRCAEETAAGWAEAMASQRPLDVAAEMMRLTLRVIGLTMFSTEVADAASLVGPALDELLHVTIHRIKDLWVAPRWLPTQANRRFDRALAEMHGLVGGYIARRRAEGPGGKQDLLDLLMAARDPETGEAMTDAQLLDEAMTIFGAGHETTANALAWTFYLLSLHPGVERRVRAEVREVLGDRPPRFEDLSRLPLVERVLFESMRLYPPVWGLERSVVEDDVIAGYEIPKGSWVLMSPFQIHHDGRFWENPEGFDPDRFLPEAVAARHKAAYLPFSLGPRKCIGEGFALVEGKLVLAALLRRAKLELEPGQRVLPDPTITLRPKGGLWMRVKRA